MCSYRFSEPVSVGRCRWKVEVSDKELWQYVSGSAIETNGCLVSEVWGPQLAAQNSASDASSTPIKIRASFRGILPGRSECPMTVGQGRTAVQLSRDTKEWSRGWTVPKKTVCSCSISDYCPGILHFSFGRNAHQFQYRTGSGAFKYKYKLQLTKSLTEINRYWYRQQV